jgi:hypothetical protein
MDLLELKIVAFGHIAGQQNLTKAEKTQLLDFVKEASEVQVLDLLTTGKMKTQKEALKDDQKALQVVKEHVEIQVESIASDTKEYWAKKAGEAGHAGKDLAKQTGKYWADKSGVPQKIEAGAKEGGTDPLGIQAGKRKELADDALARAKERAAARPKPKSTIDQATDAVSKTASDVNQWAQQNPGQAALTAAAGVAAITAGVLAYKRFFSKAARACKDKSGPQKTACMKSYKAQGKQAEIGVLTAKLSGCKGNPKCVNKIKARIAATKQDIQALKSK